MFCIRRVYFLYISPVFGQLSPLALSALSALAAPTSPVAVIYSPDNGLLLANNTGQFMIPVTTWNCVGWGACYVEFMKYVTQSGAAFPRPAAVLAPFSGSRSLGMSTLTVTLFEKYHSNVQWIFAVGDHGELLRSLRGHVCQVITVTETEISVPQDNYRNCATRRVLTNAEDEKLKEDLPHAGTYFRNDVVIYAKHDKHKHFCFRYHPIGELLYEVHRILNNTVIEMCNHGGTDSLLLDRSVDFVLDVSSETHSGSYYGYAIFSPDSLCFMTRKRGPVAPSFASTWTSFFALFLVLGLLAVAVDLALGVRNNRCQRDTRSRPNMMLFYLSTFLGRSPHPMVRSSSVSVRIASVAWMFGTFFLLQFTQTNITASRSVPATPPQIRRLDELVSRMEDGSITPCMRFAVDGIINKFGGNASHLVSIRNAVRNCGSTCLSDRIERHCVRKALNGTHFIVHMCRALLQIKGVSRGVVVGDESLLTYIKWLPTHARYPLRHQHRRVLQMLQESRISAQKMKKAFPPCPHCTVKASFDVPFSSYMNIFLVGCCSSLFIFCVELTFKRWPRFISEYLAFVKP